IARLAGRRPRRKRGQLFGKAPTLLPMDSDRKENRSMNDDVREIVHSDETVVAGTPDTVVSETETNTANTATTVNATPYVGAMPAGRQTTVRTAAPIANQSTVQTTTAAPSEQMVSRN